MTKQPPNQLSLFDYHPAHDYPLLVADKWGFNLSYADISDGRFYLASQWVYGLGATDKSAWAKVKKQLLNSNQQLKIEKISHISSNGKSYKVEFLSEQTCYLVAQNMRVTKNNPQLADIQNYLASAGCFVNWVANNPDSDFDRAFERQINTLVAKRGMTREQAHKHLLRRQSSTVARLQITDALKFHVIDDINYDTFTNKAEYLPLFNRIASQISQMTGAKNARDGMTTEALAFLEIAELTFAKRIEVKGAITFQEACELMLAITQPLGISIRQMETITGLDLATGQKLLKSHYDYE